MPLTTRLYYTDSYQDRFTSRVTDVAEDGHRVYLEATSFYPTSGGQPNDTGVLGGMVVIDVVDEGDRIAHVLSSPATFAAGAEVEGRIDWARRFDHMQQHTGQHLLSAVFEELYGARTVSVHFGADSATLDLSGGALAGDRLVAAERRANEVVWEDRPVRVGFEAAGEAAGLRKESAREGELRIVAIEGLDRSACGGTHVRATGEIGAILLRRTEKIRGDTRVEFLCGARALSRARADYDALARTAQLFSAPLDDVPGLVDSLRAQAKEASSGRKRLEEELAGYRARELYERAAPDASGVRRILDRRSAGAVDDLKQLAQAVAALPRAVLVGVVEAPPTVLLAASDDSGVNAGTALKAALSEVGGRGGGSPRLAQGSLPDAAALEAVLRALGV